MAANNAAAVGVALRRIRSAQPDLFDELLRAYAAWTDEVTVAVTETPHADVYVAIGRAQQCRKLLRMMLECHLDRKMPTPQ